MQPHPSRRLAILERIHAPLIHEHLERRAERAEHEMRLGRHRRGQRHAIPELLLARRLHLFRPHHVHRRRRTRWAQRVLPPVGEAGEAEEEEKKEAQCVRIIIAAMLNYIWFGLMAIALVIAAFNGTMGAVSTAAIESAKTGVEIAIGLVGVMTLWL